MSEYGDEPEGTFSIYYAEGEALAKQRQFKKAIESFTKVDKLSFATAKLIKLLVCMLYV